jgi:hypothetical protein
MQGAFFGNERTDYAADSEPPVFRVSRDYEIWFEE